TPDDGCPKPHAGCRDVLPPVAVCDEVLLALDLPLSVNLGQLVLILDLSKLLGEVFSELLVGASRGSAEEKGLCFGELGFTQGTAAAKLLQFLQFVREAHDFLLRALNDRARLLRAGRAVISILDRFKAGFGARAATSRSSKSAARSTVLPASRLPRCEPGAAGR